MKKLFLIVTLIGLTSFANASEEVNSSNTTQAPFCDCGAWASDQAWAEINAFGGSRQDYVRAYGYYLNLCQDEGCGTVGDVIIIGNA